jgi:hypothetical protein
MAPKRGGQQRNRCESQTDDLTIYDIRGTSAPTDLLQNSFTPRLFRPCMTWRRRCAGHLAWRCGWRALGVNISGKPRLLMPLTSGFPAYGEHGAQRAASATTVQARLAAFAPIRTAIVTIGDVCIHVHPDFGRVPKVMRDGSANRSYRPKRITNALIVS